MPFRQHEPGQADYRVGTDFFNVRSTTDRLQHSSAGSVDSTHRARSAAILFQTPSACRYIAHSARRGSDSILVAIHPGVNSRQFSDPTARLHRQDKLTLSEG